MFIKCENTTYSIYRILLKVSGHLRCCNMLLITVQSTNSTFFFNHTENVHIYDGYVSNNQSIQEATFQSPFFPNFYPHDLAIEYLIRCNSTLDIECIIEIAFTDFQISSSSIIEVRITSHIFKNKCS